MPDASFTATPDYVRDAIGQVVANLAGQVSMKSGAGIHLPTLTIE
jgi:hypothetical protein